MPYRRPSVHLVLLLGAVQEPGVAYSVLHFGEGPARALPARRGTARHQPARHKPACLIADIFVPTGNIGGWGWGKEREGRGERPQELEGRRSVRDIME